MPGTLLVALGAALIALANYDALVTTVAVGSGHRPLTQYVSGVQRRMLRQFPRLRPAAGPIILLTSVTVWITLLWAGYSLLFAAEPQAVVDARTGDPAGGVARIFYAGYTLFTLGNGGYQPVGGWWQILTNIATLNGLFVTTLAITYLVPVVSAVVQRRESAALITALGLSAEEVVATAWNGESFRFLEQQLPVFADRIMLTAQRHIAYPVLHDFRTTDRETASERTLALLDEVVTILEHGLDPSVTVDAAPLRLARAAVEQARQLMPVTPAAEIVPPLPDLGALARHGVPVRDPAEFAARAAVLDQRRCRLAALVATAAWDWPNEAARG